MCHVDGLEDLIKRSLFPKLIFIFNKITAKILQATFVEIDKLLLKFKWKCKGPQNSIIMKKNKVGVLTVRYQDCKSTLNKIG